MTLSTHVLDTARGVPAADLPVTLQRLGPQGWLTVADGKTDADGRLSRWSPDEPLVAGRHRLHFDLASYHGPGGLFPEVVVVFDITDPNGRLHLPLLLSPFGYTTYRGV
jgi:5-hydroxyisourate hydrolase